MRCTKLYWVSLISTAVFPPTHSHNALPRYTAYSMSVISAR